MEHLFSLILYLARIQHCTINCGGMALIWFSLVGLNIPLPHDFLEIARSCHAFADVAVVLTVHFLFLLGTGQKLGVFFVLPAQIIRVVKCVLITSLTVTAVLSWRDFEHGGLVLSRFELLKFLSQKFPKACLLHSHQFWVFKWLLNCKSHINSCSCGKLVLFDCYNSNYRVAHSVHMGPSE